jgi:hypothetical protein
LKCLQTLAGAPRPDKLSLRSAYNNVLVGMNLIHPLGICPFLFTGTQNLFFGSTEMLVYYLLFLTGDLLPKHLDMARPKIVQELKRIYRYVIRLNEREQQKFLAAAEVSGVEVYKLLRTKLLTGRFPEAKIARIDLGLYLELKKIGVNVNQIAKQVNAGKLPFEIRKILLQLQEQQHLIIKVLLHDRDSEDR